MRDEKRNPAKPDLGELLEDYQWCVNRVGSNIFSRLKANHDTRYCLWPNQSSDGKKWRAASGDKDVWPWAGASDARVMLVDTYINEDAALLKTVWRRNRITVTGVEANDADFASRMTQLLRWLKYTQMKEAQREMKLAANWTLEYGAAVMGVFWDRRMQLGYEAIDLEQLMAQAGEQAAFFQSLFLDPNNEPAAVDLLQSLLPDARKASITSAVKELRETGSTRVVTPQIVRERPCLVCLLPNDELFIAPEATDAQEARAYFRRELLTEATLRERAHTHEWDEAFVEEVVESQKGRLSSSTVGWSTRSRATGSGASYVPDTSKLFEVVHAYRRLPDAQGVPGIYYTCFHPGLTHFSSRHRTETLYAWHGPLGYDHGEYPFSIMERENRSRLLDQSRGYGEIATTFQAQVKAEWDSRIDRASIATLPPSFYPPGEPPSEWGPGAQIGTRQPDAYGFMDIPRYDPGSKEIEESIRLHADRYFGRRLADGSNQVESGAMRQAMADDWMEFWGRVDTQVLQLMQQYAPDELYYRVVGSQKARPLRATREEIQGQFDVTISYNTGLLVPEVQEGVFGVIEKALTWDLGGEIDRSELLAYAFEIVDASLGERVLRPAQAASVAEMEDEALAFAKIWSGQDVPVKPGQAFQVRLQYLNSMLAENEDAQKRYQTDESFRKRLDLRFQRLNHQLEQVTVNAEAGRQGG